MNIKDFRYTSRGDMATHIRDTLDIVSCVNELEVRLVNLEEKVEKLSNLNSILIQLHRK